MTFIRVRASDFKKRTDLGRNPKKITRDFMLLHRLLQRMPGLSVWGVVWMAQMGWILGTWKSRRRRRHHRRQGGATRVLNPLVLVRPSAITFVGKEVSRSHTTQSLNSSTPLPARARYTVAERYSEPSALPKVDKEIIVEPQCGVHVGCGTDHRRQGDVA